MDMFASPTPPPRPLPGGRGCYLLSESEMSLSTLWAIRNLRQPFGTFFQCFLQLGRGLTGVRSTLTECSMDVP
jgi:hypothetical protein